jgi:type I restriction enzyme S subunit
MRKYLSYKPSVEWIGEIPEHWILLKLKHEYKIQKGRIPKTINEREGVGLVPYLSMEVLRGSESSSFVSNDDGVFVKEGQTLILWDGSNSGEIIKVKKEGILSSTMGVLNKIGNKLNEDFSFYQLKSHEPEIRNNTNGMGIPHVDGQYVRSLTLLIPPLSEQEEIVKYLDEKTSIIDKLISTKERKIELLKEQRTSLINEVITKGLNPNVKMKDSGVEWIGEIPEKWDVVKIKYVTNQVVDGTHFTPNYIDSGVPFLRVTDIQSEVIDLDKVKFISKEEHEILVKRCNPQKGDILLSKNGTIGITKIIDWDWEFSIFVSLCLIKFKNTFNPFLFSYFFQSDIVNQQVFESSKKTSVSNLHLDKIRELLLIKPSLQEQQEIVEYLDKHTKEINDLVSMEQRKIELLKEYRQSLISEVITGKIKVVE